MRHYLSLIILLISSLGAFAQHDNKPFLQILGVAQDGGYPHMGCNKVCCTKAWQSESNRRFVVSLAVVDPTANKWWLFEATPDIKEQLHLFSKLTKGKYKYLPEGIIVTHAHIGHYTGLMQLGREVMNTSNIPVYTLPKMKTYLENNGPWSQLIKLNNIVIYPVHPNAPIPLGDHITLETLVVPHRDEYSETAGFKITVGGVKYLFIPDINKWEKWDHNIVYEIQQVDKAFVDATCFSNDELQAKRVQEVQHPLVTETMHLFKDMDKVTKAKIYFIHLNHTNPLLWDPKKQAEVKKAGFNIALQGQRF
ncbi:MAG: MBL fold metallo-hydrolase [Bacteroidota bacterium]